MTGRYIKPAERRRADRGRDQGAVPAGRGAAAGRHRGRPQEAEGTDRRPQQDELLREARVRLGKREDLDDDKDADVAILMMMASLNDPYTVYYDKETVRKMASQLRGRFPGVGIQIRRDAVRDGLLVVTPIKGSPAYEAGIQAGDLITEIRPQVDKRASRSRPTPRRCHSTKGMKTDDAVNIIPGKPDTPVTLVVEREARRRPRRSTLKRNCVTVETVHGVKRNDERRLGRSTSTTKYKIGYVHLTQFIATTRPRHVTDLKKAIAELKKTGLNGLVLDLRDNPGGLPLRRPSNICELFVGKEKIVTVKPRPRRGRAAADLPRRTAGDKSFADGGAGQRQQRQRQRDRRRVPPGPRPGDDHRRADLRQGERAGRRRRSTRPAARSS